MKEHILKMIIESEVYMLRLPFEPEAADKIAKHIIEFIKWLCIYTETTGDYSTIKWYVYSTSEHMTSEEVYEFWLNNIYHA